MSLKTGSKCPFFELKNQDGRLIKIEDYIGKENLVIYFYPRDETGGCTAQACEFRDLHDDFEALDARIMGISADSVESHQSFAKKYKLNFDLLADEDRKVKKMFAVNSFLFNLFPTRQTFVVDKRGIIVASYNELLNAKNHVKFAKNVLAKLD